jgi:hypothetical protein
MKFKMATTAGNFSQSDHIIGPGSHVEYPTGTKNRKFVEDHPRNIPAATTAGLSLTLDSMGKMFQNANLIEA